ncbi:phosphatase PAP2 family protein [Streptomyces sp. 4F14]|uniref:phosphatase PAP2 family protein n=1 Tax=Streptomyces sp. 4F14 TaxID=3394380 RepID=UPI003A83AB97
MHPPHLASPPRPPTHPAATRAALVLGASFALLLTLVWAEWPPVLDADGEVSRTTHRWAVDSPALTQASRILTDWVWDPLTMRLLLAVVAVGLVVRWQAWGTALWLAVTSAVGTLVQQGLKSAVGRERPVWPDPLDSAHYAAFPSGHALTATVAFGLLLWLLHVHGCTPAVWRTAVAVSAVSVVGVGLTRVFLGVHWPTDVLGGWLLGGLIVVAAIETHRRVLHGDPPP